jgi:hypothetical protein
LQLLPEDKEISSVWDKEMVDAKEYVRKLNVISTKDKEEAVEEPEKTSNAVGSICFYVGPALKEVLMTTSNQLLSPYTVALRLR